MCERKVSGRSEAEPCGCAPQQVPNSTSNSDRRQYYDDCVHNRRHIDNSMAMCPSGHPDTSPTRMQFVTEVTNQRRTLSSKATSESVRVSKQSAVQIGVEALRRPQHNVVRVAGGVDCKPSRILRGCSSVVCDDNNKRCKFVVACDANSSKQMSCCSNSSSDYCCCCCCCENRTHNRGSGNNNKTMCVVKGCDDAIGRFSSKTISYYRHIVDFKRPKFFHNTWLRLGSLLLILLLAIASVQSAPTMTLESRRLGSAPKWLNPCGIAAEELEGDVEFTQLNDVMLLGNIIMQAKTALNYAQSFRDDYIKRTFNTDYADHHSMWKDKYYDWLPGLKQIPKQLGEQLEKEYFDKLEVRMLDTALLDAYEYMQKYAVGLEQIAWDQEDHNLEFRKQFKDTEYNLRSVLCELQMALAERQVPLRADVNRDAMPSEFRSMDNSETFRNLRDWIIYRDYMNGLEYIIQVFEYIVHNIKS